MQVKLFNGQNLKPIFRICNGSQIQRGHQLIMQINNADKYAEGGKKGWCISSHTNKNTPESEQFTFNALGFIVFILVRVLSHFFSLFSLQVGQVNLKDISCHWAGHSDSYKGAKHY